MSPPSSGHTRDGRRGIAPLARGVTRAARRLFLYIYIKVQLYMLNLDLQLYIIYSLRVRFGEGSSQVALRAPRRSTVTTQTAWPNPESTCPATLTGPRLAPSAATVAGTAQSVQGTGLNLGFRNRIPNRMKKHTICPNDFLVRNSRNIFPFADLFYYVFLFVLVCFCF